MKQNSISLIGAILIALFCNQTQAQSFGSFASAVWITDCNQSNFYNTSGTPANQIGPAGNVFEGTNLGVYTQNSGTLIFRGAQVKTFKDPVASNVCGAEIYYRVYLQSGVPGAFNPISLPFLEDCNTVSSLFPSGGPCVAGDQKWNRVIPDGTTVPYAPVNLTSFTPGNYVLEVYYKVAGSFTTTTQCTDTVTLDNSGNNYRAFFSIQSPVLSNSQNPSTCNGSDGSITLSGLVPGSSFQLSYTDDGAVIGPAAFVANGAGQITIFGLNKGLYSNFIVTINGCTTNLFTGIVLSDPIFTSTFAAIPPFCSGTPAPALPTTSVNGITGSWNPAVINNLITGTYTFTPNAGTCGSPLTITVTVIPRATPTFTFGTSLTICGSGTVPVLPNTSTNGFTGSWNPAVVDDQNSGTYTFTPNANQCANPTTFTVTVNPNITPTFSFGTSSTQCAGTAVPTLPGTSTNGIAGTWSPATVDNQNSGTYTFTPNAGLCATTTTYTVTINPNVIPAFSFGGSLSICAGGSVPVLPTTSTNGITGTWTPSVVDNQNSGTYTFNYTAGQCATPVTFTVTVSPNITPTFSFGATASVCSGAVVPVLPNTSTNGIAGTWSPATVDNLNSGTYTFTPNAGLCATTTTFTVTVNPNITPTFSFGTAASVCAGSPVPTLPGTSTNGIAGTWSPATVDNQNSGTYTFTPNAGLCATTTTFTVTVDPIVNPTFSFGSSASICAGDAVPTLPNTSMNGINGTWNPSVVSNQVSGTYVFTASSGTCIPPFTFTFTVNPIVTPTFPFGTNQSVCINVPAPVLPNTSSNGITGTWSPAVVDNQASGTYTFTPTAGLCATTTTLTYEVNPITPSTSIRADTTVYDGDILPAYNFISTPGSGVNWTNSDETIGLAVSGTGPVPSFKAINITNASVTATITATPFINGCNGTAQIYLITVLPLNKDIFVPNVFSPNGDGKNDILYIYGNYINTVEMHIFNQWGQKIAKIASKSEGWDGRHKGSPQPVGVYVYVLKAVLIDGRTVSLKGSVTLVR